MRSISNMMSLESIARQGGELVAYGKGTVSSDVLRWLDYQGLLANISCIAVKDESSMLWADVGVPSYRIKDFF